MNQRVPAGHFRRLQHNRVRTGSSKGTTVFDQAAAATGCFQPGTFFWERAHADGCYQRPTIDAKCLQRTQAPSRGVRIPGGVAELARLTVFDLNSGYFVTMTNKRDNEGESLWIDFNVLSGVTSGRILRSKRAERASDSRNDACNQSLPKVWNRNPGRRA